MTGRLRHGRVTVLTALASVLAVVLVLGLAGPARAQNPEGAPSAAAVETEGGIATLRIEQATLARGQQVVFEGAGWPANTLVTLELCGGGGQHGSVACDTVTSRSVATFADGRLRGELLVTAPPEPCPCVAHAFVPNGDVDLQVPVEILGHPVAEVAPAKLPVRAAEITSVQLSGDGGFGSWLGSSPRRKLTVTVANTGDVELHNVGFRARWGTSDQATRLIDLPEVAALAPGEQATVAASFGLDAWASGDVTATVNLVGFAGDAQLARTSVFPWPAVLLAALACIALGTLLILRRRNPDEQQVDDPDPEAGGLEDPDGSGSAAAPFAAAEPEPEAEAAQAPVAASRVRWTGVVLGVLAVGGLATGCSSKSGAEARELDEKALCEALAEIDPGTHLGGRSLPALVGATVAVRELRGRVPEDLAKAVETLSATLDRHAAAADLPASEIGDGDYAGAYQAAYKLRYSPDFTASSAAIEAFAVERCGLLPSGNFTIPEHRGSYEDATRPTLPEGPLDGSTLEFDPEVFTEFELEPFEIPEVTFNGDLGEFELERPHLEAPDLSAERHSGN